MRDFPSINQVSVLGRITEITHKPGRDFSWNFNVAVYREYGSADGTDDIEAEITCGVGSGVYGEMVQNADVGDWVAVQGKIK